MTDGLGQTRITTVSVGSSERRPPRTRRAPERSALCTRRSTPPPRTGARWCPAPPNAFSPNAFSPNAFSPNAFSPNAFSPNVFSPNAFSMGGQVVSRARACKDRPPPPLYISAGSRWDEAAAVWRWDGGSDGGPPPLGGVAFASEPLGGKPSCPRSSLSSLPSKRRVAGWDFLTCLCVGCSRGRGAVAAAQAPRRRRRSGRPPLGATARRAVGWPRGGSCWPRTSS
eukprot:COSAG01_NODE_7512_length_3175_cov_9.576398_3_plen_226_part_00